MAFGVAPRVLMAILSDDTDWRFSSLNQLPVELQVVIYGNVLMAFPISVSGLELLLL